MSRRIQPIRLVVPLLLATAAPAWAQQPAVPAGAPPHAAPDTTHATRIDSLQVIGRREDLRGIARSASEGRIGAVDLRARPLSREGELLESVPGVILTQHSGDGKANQMFVRGFNLDHGTDFQTRVEGMPVNLPSHAHGQGYSDLNFLVPELVESIDYQLGVQHAELGDFGSAGGAQFRLARTLPRPFSVVGTGANGFARVAAGASALVGGGTLLAGGEVKGYNGPWQVAEELRKFSGLARYSWTRGASAFSLLGMAYRNRWDSSDQIPLRAVTSGLIDRFGQIDNTLGGRSQRYSLSGEWRHAGGSAVDLVQLFGIYSDLDLYSNFTYALDNPVQGDQFNQREHRYIVGANATRKQPFEAAGTSHLLTLGLQSRLDLVRGVGLHRTAQRRRTGTIRQDDVTESGSGLFLELDSRWRPWFRSIVGLRGDAYTFDVSSIVAANSGRRSAAIASPKLSLVFTPGASTEVYVGAGLGFHSNDARGTTISVDPVSGDPVARVDPLVRSRGAEIGVRTSPVVGLRSTLELWAIDLNSELLFVGDGGTTEPSNRSQRRGITLANFYRPIPQLTLDADVSFARARYADVPADGTRIPGALENVVAGGITWQPLRRGLFGAIRVRHFGAYPLIEDNSARATPTTLLNAEAGYRFAGVRLQVSVLNLLNRRASDIQYYYASRLPGEPEGGVNDVHFHPVEPRQVRVSVGWGI